MRGVLKNLVLFPVLFSIVLALVVYLPLNMWRLSWPTATAAIQSSARQWFVTTPSNRKGHPRADIHYTYIWKGDEEVAEDDFAGVGYFRFSLAEGSTTPDQATGWFTSGNIDQLIVTDKQKVELRRASKTDAKTMLSKNRHAKGTAASLAYSNWIKTFGDSKHGEQPIENAEDAT